MAYVMMYGVCLECQRTFGFNPHRVPSLTVNGVREPICRECILHANTLRRDQGVDEFVIHPDAYEAINESEL
jgi:hypothetical protein